MIALRHRTASGDVSSCWDFDPVRRCAELVFRLGSAEPIALTVPVCSQIAPRLGAWAVMRMGAEAWRILPLRFTRVDARIVVPEERAIHPAIGFEPIVLSNTPPVVAEELERL